ncbi:MAG: Type II secretion system protein G precursor [Syntrophaceae bacterium PtaB.Bin038]|nr:MAG: Type II secretion system protein G precursor [Syntrophaceae bacterium PtaB.Bin038]
MNPLSRKDRCRSRKGFTLIEIIAVLVILGVLSAVAAPKFIGLKTEAENRAALQAVVEAQNRLTNQYAIKLMTSQEQANDLPALLSSVSTDAGDYRLSFAVAGSEIEITASGIPEKGVTGTARGKWRSR